MSYTLTVYCSDCNWPKHTGSRETKIGETATAGLTVAVCKKLYDKYKGRRIHLTVYDKNKETILSEHEPYIQDIHGNKDDVIDLYIGERPENECDCKNHIWSLKPCDFYLMD